MAIVESLTRLPVERDVKHSVAEYTYCIVTTDGRKYLQIDTYGSTRRQMKGKKSQSIRFAPRALTQLKRLLAEEF